MDGGRPPRPRPGDRDRAALPRPASEARLIDAGRPPAGRTAATARQPGAHWLLPGVALLIGLGIGLLDGRPSWDDTGVTAMLLVIAAATVAWLDGTRPWCWALLVGAPLAIIEVPASGSAAPLAGLAFASVGAVAGWFVARATGRGGDPGGETRG